MLRAAARLFAERGLEVSLDDIAHEAGLGVGTGYRRFADREEIIAVLFAERIEATAAVARACLDDEDPWRGLLTLLRRGCQEVATDRGMRQVLLSKEGGDENAAAGRAVIQPLATELVSRCHAAGKLRPGFAASDIPMLFLMIGAVGDLAGRRSPELWERYFEMIVDGIRDPARPAPAVPALDDDALHAAIAAYRPGTVR